MTSTITGAALAATTTVLSSTINLSISASSSLVADFTAFSKNATNPSPNEPTLETGNCRLLGPFAILVQAALGALALLSLVFKRWRERPQRPVKIWAFDVSKQVFGTALLHIANLFMSMFSSGELEAQLAKAAAKSVGANVDEDWRPNPCSFYLLNLAIDTTLGIPILLLILKVLHIGASRTPLANPPESIKSGHYGDPPRASWWLKQSILYFFGLLLMKACVFFIFELCPWIVVVGDWALKWTEGNQALQIAFVMLIFPLIMNAFQVCRSQRRRPAETNSGSTMLSIVSSRSGQKPTIVHHRSHRRAHRAKEVDYWLATSTAMATSTETQLMKTWLTRASFIQVLKEFQSIKRTKMSLPARVVVLLR